MWCVMPVHFYSSENITAVNKCVHLTYVWTTQVSFLSVNYMQKNSLYIQKIGEGGILMVLCRIIS